MKNIARNSINVTIHYQDNVVIVHRVHPVNIVVTVAANFPQHSPQQHVQHILMHNVILPDVVDVMNILLISSEI